MKECWIVRAHEGPSIPEVRAWKKPCQWILVLRRISGDVLGSHENREGRIKQIRPQLVVGVNHHRITLGEIEGRARERSVRNNSARIL
jgi:hypothetical protein